MATKKAKKTAKKASKKANSKGTKAPNTAAKARTARATGARSTAARSTAARSTAARSAGAKKVVAAKKSVVKKKVAKKQLTGAEKKGAKKQLTTAKKNVDSKQPVAAKKLAPRGGAKKSSKPKKNKTIFFDDGFDLDLMLEDEVVLRDAEGRQLCRSHDCDQVAVADEYCRFHYLTLWKKITRRRQVLEGSKLENYLRELTKPYSDKMIDILRKDLKTEKNFLSSMRELGVSRTEDEVIEDEHLDENTATTPHPQTDEELRALKIEADKPVKVDENSL